MDIYVKISLAIRLTYGICILIVNFIKRKKKYACFVDNYGVALLQTVKIYLLCYLTYTEKKLIEVKSLHFQLAAVKA
jgi:hypothetical protein